eukprot:TRINITY_DN8177_c0_g1_i1.p1 TRINITY_DN8177_c0_g1~~TRINITY_DN8177_c0_g1_i1.p1  ORF type:complete len:159 (+),score=35.72 TRINITY_DN8177_c0_g1_i1:70-546(+)
MQDLIKSILDVNELLALDQAKNIWNRSRLYFDLKEFKQWKEESLNSLKSILTSNQIELSHFQIIVKVLQIFQADPKDILACEMEIILRDERSRWGDYFLFGQRCASFGCHKQALIAYEKTMVLLRREGSQDYDSIISECYRLRSLSYFQVQRLSLIHI